MLNKNPSVKVIADSITKTASGDVSRITTLQLRYPRLVHSEFMTHRVFSRNASSSRAIPIQKMIDQVRNDPAAPFKWTTNKPGMQGDVITDPDMIALCDKLWIESANRAADDAERLMAEGLHKQVVNRLLEPYQWISVIVTATDWSNWFTLRDHKDADPTIEALAKAMRTAMEDSVPTKLAPGEWHLPYISSSERAFYPLPMLVKMSAARCARVSYLTHDGKLPDTEKDIALYEKLIVSEPMHASPVEHQAKAAELNTYMGGNLGYAWVQHRKLLENNIAVR